MTTKIQLFKQYIKLEENCINYFFNGVWINLPNDLKEKIVYPIIKNSFSKNYKELDKKFEFINYVNKNNFIEVIKQIKFIIEEEIGLTEEEIEVRDSSIWAVCTSFLQYKGLIDNRLNDFDLYYTSNRSGVLTSKLTVIDLIQEFDGEGYFEWIKKF
jgi:hypothetical protein